MGYNKMGFENKVCSRCGGTGRYSYCSAYGSTCFNCNGSGYIYTKKGISALNFFRESMEIYAKNVVVGMIHQSQPGKKWFPIVEVSDKIQCGCIAYSTNGCTYHRDVNSKITAMKSIEQYSEKLIEAIRFQSRLTKSGTEAKKYIKMRETK